jgi:hypothetical protein
LALAGAMVAFGAWGKVARKVRITGVLMPPHGIGFRRSHQPPRHGQ